MMKTLLVLLLGFALAGCSTLPVSPPSSTGPVAAVRGADEHPLQGIRGRFTFTVHEIGSTRGKTYLDSEWNYRDHNNLTIAMTNQTANAVAKRLGAHIMQLMNRRIVVNGVARRVRIDYVNQHGQPTGWYYHQVHVRVTSPSQINFAQ